MLRVARHLLVIGGLTLIGMSMLLTAVEAAGAPPPYQTLRPGEEVAVRGTDVACGVVGLDGTIACILGAPRLGTLAVYLSGAGVSVARFGSSGEPERLFARNHPGERPHNTKAVGIEHRFVVGPGFWFHVAGTGIRCYVIRARQSSTGVACGFLDADGVWRTSPKYVFEFTSKYVEVLRVAKGPTSSSVFFRMQP